MLYFFYIVFFLVFLEFFVIVYTMNKKKKNNNFIYSFSRYNMYNYKEGNYKFGYASEKIECTFNITEDGYLDKIRKADVLLLGGSSAFGVGSKGNDYNISGFLKKKYNIDIINLSIPGWNLEQEVITILRYIEQVKPRQIILFDGANNLAFGLPFDYHNNPIASSPYAFYGEKEYKKNYEAMQNESMLFQIKNILRLLFRHSFIVRIIYKKIISRNSFSEVGTKHLDVQALIKISVDNYIKWVNLLSAVCLRWDIDLIIATQPYYIYGKDDLKENEVEHFNSINKFFDDYMLKAYDILDKELEKISTIKYFPIFKLYQKFSPLIFTDAVHLKTDGYEIIADYLYTKIGGYNVEKIN